MGGAPILFQEVQRFKNPYVWVFLLLLSSIIVGSVVWLLARQFGQGDPVGGEALPAPVLAGLGGVIITADVAVVLYFAALKLQCEVTEEGLFLRFFPMHRRTRRIDLGNVTQISVAEGNAVAAYGGIGIRKRRHTTAYLLHGQGGIRIDYGNGCHLFLGSHHAETLAEALRGVTEVQE